MFTFCAAFVLKNTFIFNLAHLLFTHTINTQFSTKRLTLPASHIILCVVRYLLFVRCRVDTKFANRLKRTKNKKKLSLQCCFPRRKQQPLAPITRTQRKVVFVWPWLFTFSCIFCLNNTNFSFHISSLLNAYGQYGVKIDFYRNISKIKLVFYANFYVYWTMQKPDKQNKRKV